MKLSEPLISAASIQTRVRELGAEITAAQAGRELVVIAVLKGAAIFAADLLRELRCPVHLEFIRVRSYAGTGSTGTHRFTHYPELDLRDRRLLVLEDILDTGRTATVILEWLHARDPASVAVCTLLDKPSRREVPISADFTGFTINDHFVVGYGLDHEERYRELPDLRVLLH